MYDAIFPKAGATALLVVDIQERLLPAMGDQLAPLLRQVNVLVETAREFAWPVVYSEQYPKGLGTTEPALLATLEAVGAQRVEKVEFSCCRNPQFVEAVLPSLPNSVIVVGMETHICVLQTVVDLQARGHQVFVPWDGVSSRTLANRDNGLRLIERAGAVVTNAESLMFAALQQAGTEPFKRLSKLIR